jgi:hypothetical protein
MDPGLTAVQILDYSLTGHVNLEADIRLPEPEGIVQVETFGVSVNAYGTCFYGLQLEAVMDRSVCPTLFCHVKPFAMHTYSSAPFQC